MWIHNQWHFLAILEILKFTALILIHLSNLSGSGEDLQFCSLPWWTSDVRTHCSITCTIAAPSTFSSVSSSTFFCFFKPYVSFFYTFIISSALFPSIPKGVHFRASAFSVCTTRMKFIHGLSPKSATCNAHTAYKVAVVAPN